MKFEEKERRIRALIKLHLPDYHFRFDNRTTTLGLHWGNLKLITLSKSYVELNPWKDIRDTVLHEVAHGLVGSEHNHDKVWKAKAKELGAAPYRCAQHPVISPPKKFIGTCPTCGREIYRNARRNISCGKCSKTYNPQHKFVWRRNENQ